jgi:hypothetical protein
MARGPQKMADELERCVYQLGLLRTTVERSVADGGFVDDPMVVETFARLRAELDQLAAVIPG